jgi:hypothetical protein
MQSPVHDLFPVGQHHLGASLSDSPRHSDFSGWQEATCIQLRIANLL